MNLSVSISGSIEACHRFPSFELPYCNVHIIYPGKFNDTGLNGAFEIRRYLIFGTTYFILIISRSGIPLALYFKIDFYEYKNSKKKIRKQRP